jgi:hypothetical protein
MLVFDEAKLRKTCESESSARPHVPRVRIFRARWIVKE